MTVAAAAHTPKRTGEVAAAWRKLPVTKVPDGYESRRTASRTSRSAVLIGFADTPWTVLALARVGTLQSPRREIATSLLPRPRLYAPNPAYCAGFEDRGDWI